MDDINNTIDANVRDVASSTEHTIKNERGDTDTAFDEKKHDEEQSKKSKSFRYCVVGGCLIALLLVIIGIFVMPIIFPTPQTLIKQGKFEEAYERATKEGKDEILVGNIVTYCTKDAFDALASASIDANGLELKNAYYDGSINFILEMAYRNSLGVKEPLYIFYKYMNTGELKVFHSFSEYDIRKANEDIFGGSEDLESRINNAAVHLAKGIIDESSNQVDSIYIDEINSLIKSGELETVKLMPQVSDFIESEKSEHTKNQG